MYTDSYPNTSGIKSVQHTHTHTHTHIHDSIKVDMEVLLLKFFFKILPSLKFSHKYKMAQK